MKPIANRVQSSVRQRDVKAEDREELGCITASPCRWNSVAEFRGPNQIHLSDMVDLCIHQRLKVTNSAARAFTPADAWCPGSQEVKQGQLEGMMLLGL